MKHAYAWLAVLVTLTCHAEDARTKPLVVLVDSESVSAAGRFRKQLEEVSSIELRTAEVEKLDAATLDAAGLIVLRGSAIGADAVGEIVARVDRGASLIFVAAGGAPFSSDTKLARVLGAQLDKGDEAHETKSEPLAVAVVDQRHPITQSVTHFLHRGRLSGIRLEPSSRVLASALPRERKLEGDPVPVIWTSDQRGGRAWSCLLDLEAGESMGLVASLVERAVEWSIGKRIRVCLEADGKIRWLAESLGPEDVGLVSGRAAAEGFFRGRQIAPFMTYHGADWLVRPGREETEQPEKVLDSLNIQPGDTVADLGCGNGYFTLRMAKRVGDRGRALGVDIQKEMLTLLVERARAANIRNVEPVLARANDPRLPDDAVDLVLMVDAYHELAHPAGVMRHVRQALRKGGRVVLVEYRGEDPSVPIKPLHRMTERQARAELEAMGFQWVETKGFLPQQHVLIFAKADGGKKE